MLLDAADLHLQTLAQLGINGAQRLIQQQNFWPGDDGAGQCHTLLLTSGELFGLGFVFACQPYRSQDCRNISADLADRSLHDTLCKCYIFINITVIQQSEILEHHAQVTTESGDLSVL